MQAEKKTQILDKLVDGKFSADVDDDLSRCLDEQSTGGCCQCYNLYSRWDLNQ